MQNLRYSQLDTGDTYDQRSPFTYLLKQFSIIQADGPSFKRLKEKKQQLVR